MRKYLDGALALARAGDAYRTDAEYKDARASRRVSAKTSRFTGVAWNDLSARGKWRAQISVRGTQVELGLFYDEEDAARAYDAARVKYKGAPTVNFPGEAPSASVLAALPPAPPPAPRRRSGRAPAPKVIFDAPDERPPSHQRQAGCPKKRKAGAYAPRCVEGATQKVNGKWTNAAMFPGREFDNLREYRAAKEQRAARREEYSAQIPDSSYQKEYRARHARPPVLTSLT